MRTPSLRRPAVGLAIVAITALALGACKSGGSTTSSGTGATKPGATKAAGGGGAAQGPNPACTDAIHAAVVALVTVPVGPAISTAGANGGDNRSCVFGIGANAAVSDANQLMFAEDDTVLVTVVPGPGVSMYSQVTGLGNPVTVPGVGDKAEYYYVSAVGAPPDFYALKGQTYCEVAINAADAPTELGVPGLNAGNISADGAKAVATKEGAICNAAFGQ